MATFADMLLYLRKREGISQQLLADKTKLTRSAISMYETGNREPDFETLEVLADFFNVNMDTLLGKTEQTGAETKKSPDTLLDIEGMSESKRALYNYVMSLTDDEADKLRSYAEFVLSQRG